ncbi:UNVERIFIED_CONTAM: hypothetical protein RMT77_019871 [Armadillidium vulgare]
MKNQLSLIFLILAFFAMKSYGQDPKILHPVFYTMPCTCCEIEKFWHQCQEGCVLWRTICPNGKMCPTNSCPPGETCGASPYNDCKQEKIWDCVFRKCIGFVPLDNEDGELGEIDPLYNADSAGGQIDPDP